MRVKGILAEDFVNYKVPSMFIMTAACDWKCCFEARADIGMCQNSPLAGSPTIDVGYDTIYDLFTWNGISKAVVVGGLEPFLQADELYGLIAHFRIRGEQCDFVVYTGYYPHEIKNDTDALARFGNIIVKFGRYIPNRKPKYDELLGVTLASDNQFAMRIA